MFVTRKRPRGAGADPPRRRARAGRGGAGAVSRHAGHHRAGDRGRLLLRLRPQRTVHARRTSPPIEAKMREIVARGEPFVRRCGTATTPSRFFEDKGEKYKARDSSRTCRATETITLYRQGNWIDLCRGPHMRTTGDVGNAFKLMKVAGAYWRGDHRNAMLQPHLRHRLARPEGTRRLPAHAGGGRAARPSPHRQGDGSVPPPGGSAVGSVFWHPKGWKLYRRCEDYMRRRLKAAATRR